MHSKNILIKMLFLITIFIITIVISTMIGIADIKLIDTGRIIASKIPLLSNIIDQELIDYSHQMIILNIRLPRILLAAIVGMALASSGVVFQGVFKNPMAEPYVLGISSGAAFGATIMMLLEVNYNFLGLTAISFGAFLGAIFTTFIVYNIAQVENRTPVVTLLLSGIAISFFLTALINLIMALNRDHLTNIVYWTMGSVSSASWAKIGITIIPVFIGIIIFMIFSRDLNIILLGEDTAYNLGIEVELVKKILLITASLVAAAVVAVSGIIGFVGLIIPHAMRLLIGPDHRRLIPFSILGGGLFMIVSDTIARTIVAPTELPIGVITALIGAPYFVFLLIKNKKVLN